MNIRMVISIIFIVIGYNSYSQMNPDSLIGTYAGEYWLKWEEDTNWTISDDTVYILEIDENCRMIARSDNPYIGGTWIPYETSYNFCKNNSNNWFHRFHSNDSLTIIYDNVSPPPPNYHVSSNRFYGEKISSDIPTRVDKSDIVNSMNIFPNPFNDYIFIQFHNNFINHVIIYNLAGNIVHNVKYFSENEINISTSNLSNGIYLVHIISNSSVQIFKLIKN